MPKSMARSLEKTLNSERTPCVREEREWKPFDDMNVELFLTTRSYCTATVAFMHRYFFESLITPPFRAYALFRTRRDSISAALGLSSEVQEGMKQMGAKIYKNLIGGQWVTRRPEDLSQPQSGQYGRCGGRVSGLRRGGRGSRSARGPGKPIRRWRLVPAPKRARDSLPDG